jgi:hypothetical protein
MSASELNVEEVASWFPSEKEKEAVVNKWMEAETATLLCSDKAVATAIWTTLCRVLRMLHSDLESVIDRLNNHIHSMARVGVQPGSSEREGARAASVASKRAEPASSVASSAGPAQQTEPPTDSEISLSIMGSTGSVNPARITKISSRLALFKKLFDEKLEHDSYVTANNINQIFLKRILQDQTLAAGKTPAPKTLKSYFQICANLSDSDKSIHAVSMNKDCNLGPKYVVIRQQSDSLGAMRTLWTKLKGTVKSERKRKHPEDVEDESEKEESTQRMSGGVEAASASAETFALLQPQPQHKIGEMSDHIAREQSDDGACSTELQQTPTEDAGPEMQQPQPQQSVVDKNELELSTENLEMKSAVKPDAGSVAAAQPRAVDAESSASVSEPKNAASISVDTVPADGSTIIQSAQETDDLCSSICSGRKKTQKENRPCVANSLVSDEIIMRIEAVCSQLGIEISQRDDNENTHFIVFGGTFRGVEIELKLDIQTVPHPIENKAFHEVDVREFKLNEYDNFTVWREVFPMNETLETLDVVVIQLPESCFYGVIHEQEHCRAGALIDDLTARCGSGTLDPPFKEIRFLLRAALTLIARLHSHNLAGCGPLGNFLLSKRKDGHGKKAAAWVHHHGFAYVLLLGDALYAQKAGYQYHTRQCQCIKNIIAPSEHAKRKQVGRRASGSTTSRQVMKKCCMVKEEIEQLLAATGNVRTLTDTDTAMDVGNLECCRGNYNTPEFMVQLKGRDIRNTADTILSILRGASSSGQGERFQGGSKSTVNDLYSYCMSVAGSGSCIVRELPARNKELLELLELLRCMIAGEKSADELLALPILRELEDIALSHPEGMESIPEALPSFACEKLTQSIASRNLHYFIPGEEGVANSVFFTRISVWLVYKRADSEGDADAVRWSRSLFSGQIGKKNDVAAIYSSPYIYDPTQLDLRDQRWIIQLPSQVMKTPAMDGKPRSHSAAPLAVEKKVVGCFADSTKDEANRPSKVINLFRKWDPDPRRLSTDRSVGTPVMATMALMLKMNVDVYEELIYSYDWVRYEGQQKSAGRGKNAGASSRR